MIQFFHDGIEIGCGNNIVIGSIGVFRILRAQAHAFDMGIADINDFAKILVVSLPLPLSLSLPLCLRLSLIIVLIIIIVVVIIVRLSQHDHVVASDLFQDACNKIRSAAVDDYLFAEKAAYARRSRRSGT